MSGEATHEEKIRARAKTGAEPSPLCDRCARKPGAYRWVAGNRAAGDYLTELWLCTLCGEALKALLRNYGNKLRQKAAAARGACENS
jgi:hypothetical protein